MHNLKLTDNQLSSNGYYTKKCNYVFMLKDIELFDQNGYDLSKIEQLYSIANNITFKDHRTFRQAIKYDWFLPESISEGSHLNHALLFERKGFAGEAYEELLKWCKEYPLFYKVLKIKPKWGLDISVDYCDKEGNVFEVLHWEYDGFNYEEIMDKKIRVEEKLVNIDWDDLAKKLLERRDEWYDLDFFKQSHYKCNFIGLEDEKFKMVIWE